MRETRLWSFENNGTVEPYLPSPVQGERIINRSTSYQQPVWGDITQRDLSSYAENRGKKAGKPSHVEKVVNRRGESKVL
jgi:hypothetical protein